MAALLIPLGVVGIVPLGEVSDPGDSFYFFSSDTEDEDERELERELERCGRADNAHVLVRIVASEPLGRVESACAQLLASVGTPRERVETNSAPRAYAFSDLTRQVIDGRMAVGVLLVVIALGGLIASLGLGRIAAGLLIIPCLVAYRVDLLPIVLGAALPALALFLACAHYGDGPRTPSDSRAALIVSFVLVPLISVAIVLLSINSGSGRTNVRLTVAFVLCAVAWGTTGIPLSTFIHRVRAAAAGQAEPPRMLIPRVAISVMILASAASFAGAIAGP